MSKIAGGFMLMAGLFCASASASTIFTYGLHVTGSGSFISGHVQATTSGYGTSDVFGAFQWSGTDTITLSSPVDDAGAFTIVLDDGSGSLGGTFRTTLIETPGNTMTVSQVLTITSGTGAYAGFRGTATAAGTGRYVLTNPPGGSFDVSGSGSVGTPEPATIIPLAAGILLLVARRRTPVRRE